MRIDHGTRRGFQQHKRLGGIPCEPCEDANRTYMREYQRKVYTPEKRRAAYHRRLEMWGHP